MRKRTQLHPDDLYLYLCLEDELLFLLLFWREDLSREMSVAQKYMVLDRSRKVSVCTGRKIAKTLCIESKVIRLGLIHFNREGLTEALMFAPRDSHLAPIFDRILARLSRNPFFNAFLKEKRRGEAPRLLFAGGLAWYFRIEGTSGTDQNMVGLRAEYILGDEMAFGNWICHNSRIQTALPDATWWYSGVPNGVRNTPFYAIDKTELGKDWSRHKYNTYVNPIYDDEEKKRELIDAYGGENTQGYQTQVLGEWGEELLSSFPPDAISVSSQPYFTKLLTSALRNDDSAVALALGLPAVRADIFCIGWDYGYSPDPSVLLIAYRRGPIDRWECYARIVMRQVPLPLQIRVLRHLYHRTLLGTLGAVCCDKGEAIQSLQDKDPHLADRFHRTIPGGVTPLLDESGKLLLESDPKTGKIMPAMTWVKQYLTENIRQWMINANLSLAGRQFILGNDMEMVEELTGTTERKGEHGRIIYYGPPDPDHTGVMMDHNTDALRHLADAIQHSLEKPVDEDETGLISVMGWVGKAVDWVAPW